MEKVNIQQIGQLLLANKSFVQKLRQTLQQEKTVVVSSSIDLQRLIDEIRQLLHELIQQQLQNQLKQIIEDNNRILKQVQCSLIKQNKENKTHQFSQDISFNQVHRIMDEERKKLVINEDINDASLEKSISAFVELKVQTIQQKVNTIDKRLKGMEDKYQTNLKSIWNVLSITQGAIFDHLKQTKASSSKCKMASVLEPEPQPQRKSIFGFKFGK